MALLQSILAWLQVNWQPLLVALLAIDQVLVGLFPKIPLFGSLGSILSSLKGPPAVPPAPPAA